MSTTMLVVSTLLFVVSGGGAYNEHAHRGNVSLMLFTIMLFVACIAAKFKGW